MSCLCWCESLISFFARFLLRFCVLRLRPPARGLPSWASAGRPWHSPRCNMQAPKEGGDAKAQGWRALPPPPTSSEGAEQLVLHRPARRGAARVERLPVHLHEGSASGRAASAGRLRVVGAVWP